MSKSRFSCPLWRFCHKCIPGLTPYLLFSFRPFVQCCRFLLLLLLECLEYCSTKIHLFIICQTFILPHKGCSSQLDRGGSLSSVDGHRGACFLVRTAEDSLGLPAFLLGSPYATAGVIVQLCLLCAASGHFADACLLRVCMTLDDTPLRSYVLVRAWQKVPG